MAVYCNVLLITNSGEKPELIDSINDKLIELVSGAKFDIYFSSLIDVWALKGKWVNVDELVRLIAETSWQEPEQVRLLAYNDVTDRLELVFGSIDIRQQIPQAPPA